MNTVPISINTSYVDIQENILLIILSSLFLMKFFIFVLSKSKFCIASSTLLY